MKIDERAELGTVAAGSTKGAGSTGAVSGHSSGKSIGSAGRSGEDRAGLSGLARHLTQATSEATPERAEQLKHLAAKVGAGAYTVDSNAVARGLVKDLLLDSAALGPKGPGNS